MKLKPIWIQLHVDQKPGRVEEVPKEKRRRLELCLSRRRQASHRPIPEKKKKKDTRVDVTVLHLCLQYLTLLPTSPRKAHGL